MEELKIESKDDTVPGGRISEKSKYSIYLSTVSAGTIRTLFEALKEILTDVNIHFDNTGFKIMNMDGSKIALVHLKLEADKFEQYHCEKPMYIGVNMLSFFKLLKTIGNNDTVTFYIEEKDSNNLGILVSNKEKSFESNIKLKLLDLDDIKLNIPDVTYDSVITMPCPDFQKYCRDLFAISDIVTISSNKNIFTMQAAGDFAEQTISIGETSNGLVMSKKEAEVSGRFPLKYLNLFCKSSNLCSNVKLFLKDKFPLIIIFDVANLGSVKYCVAPRTEES